MPGVTSLNAGPHAFRSVAASWAEQTTPSRPHALVNCASARTSAAAVPAWPISRKSASARLVSTVTPISSGGVLPRSDAALSTASRAARSIARPPLACTFSIHTPSRTAAAHAFATVLGMSWNLRSRNTLNPRSASQRTGSGPALTNSSLPTFSAHCCGSRRSANASAAIGLAKSSATITRGLVAVIAVSTNTHKEAPRRRGKQELPSILPCIWFAFLCVSASHCERISTHNHRASPCAAANTSPNAGSRGSASSTAWRESRNGRICTCRGA